ncbi:DUF305 domain-containing protein [Nonomuraea sp. NPDC049750]|uniref:DUF305 domain-containing protein n=1 Tax=Nonomuraea sp. NPDC049750 TaxID=3154738 RepID=UPI0033D00047
MSDEADYLRRMVAHHQEAVAAARQLQRSGRAQIRTLGASIVTTQSAEIATMNTWLATWYRRHSPVTGYRPMMRDLSKLSGDALDENVSLRHDPASHDGGHDVPAPAHARRRPAPPGCRLCC